MSEKSHVGMFNCYFCGQPAGVLLDRTLRKSLPMNVGVIDMSPCSKCAELMKQGVMLIEVVDGQFEGIEAERLKFKVDWDLASDVERKKMRPFIPNPSRTGRIWVIKEEAVSKMFEGKLAEQVVKTRWTFIEASASEKVGLPAPESVPVPEEKPADVVGAKPEEEKKEEK